MNTAIIHEWLVNYAGSEKCLESFVNIWPEADVFTLVDFLNGEERGIILNGKETKTSFIQYMPYARKQHRKYLPLFPKAIESFDLSDYNIIFSSSHSVAKGVRTKENQLHICYCHTPMRYAWDEAGYYLSQANLTKGFRGVLAQKVVQYLRKWDLKSADNVDYFIANSSHIAQKIRRIYNREADVIYPPVDTNKFSVSTEKSDFYLTASRLVPYKRVDLIIDAFSKLPDRKLVVIGSGPDKEKILNKASSNIDILGYQDFETLRNYMQKARAFVFSAEEDFGIVPIEALSCGTPVIALNRGGTAETIEDGVTGIHFANQTVEDLQDAIERFEKIQKSFDPIRLHDYAKKFDRSVFEEKISKYVKEKAESFFRKNP